MTSEALTQVSLGRASNFTPQQSTESQSPLTRVGLSRAGDKTRAELRHTDLRSAKNHNDSSSENLPQIDTLKKSPAANFRDKLGQFWRDKSSLIIMGLLTGAGVGAAVGGIAGLVGSAGAFSVPMAIIGAAIGAPVGALLFTLGFGAFEMHVDSDIAGTTPKQTHAEKNEIKTREEAALNGAVPAAFSRIGHTQEDAKAWQKALLSWVGNKNNFAFWNRTTPPKEGNVLDRMQYKVTKGLSRNIPYFSSGSREAGYERIAGYKEYIAQVLSQEKDAFLDVSRIVPAPIKSMPPGLLKGFANVEHLAVNGSCSLASLPSHMLNDLPNLKDLSISGNRYDSDGFVDSTYQSLHTLPADFFAGTPALESLTLSNNDLIRLPAGIFQNLPNLKTLDLSGNEKLQLTKELAQGLTNLEELNLSGMDLKALPMEFLENLPNLKRLDISGNDLSQLPADVFKGLSNLEEINFEGNGLQALPRNLKTNLPNLKAIRVDLESDTLRTLPDGFARLLLSSPGCFPDFDAKYVDRLNVDQLVSYVEGGSVDERLDRLKLLYTPGLVEKTATSLDLSNLKNLTALPEFLDWHLHTLDLSNNEKLSALPESLSVDRLVLTNCGPRRNGGSSLGALAHMANKAKEKLSHASTNIGVEENSLLDDDGVLTVYGSIDLEGYTFNLPSNLAEDMRAELDEALGRDKYEPNESLVDNMRVLGSVSIGGPARLTIPSGVVIHGDFSLKGVTVESFPDDLEVMGKIYIDEAYRAKLSGNLQEFPEHLRGKVEVR